MSPIYHFISERTSAAGCALDIAMVPRRMQEKQQNELSAASLKQGADKIQPVATLSSASN
jgi:hypothetical protein